MRVRRSDLAPSTRLMNPRHARGFTLLEIVVVIFLIGVIASFAVLSVGGNRARVVEEEARRLQSLMQLASSETVGQDEQWAVELFRNGYRFMRLEQAETTWQWMPIEDKDVFRQRCLPPDLHWEAEVEGLATTLDPIDCEKKKDGAATGQAGAKDSLKKKLATPNPDEKIPPRVFILSSGEITPFKLTLKVPEKDDYYRVVGELTGKLTLLTAADEKHKS